MAGVQLLTLFPWIGETNHTTSNPASRIAHGLAAIIDLGVNDDSSPYDRVLRACN